MADSRTLQAEKLKIESLKYILCFLVKFDMMKSEKHIMRFYQTDRQQEQPTWHMQNVPKPVIQKRSESILALLM